MPKKDWEIPAKLQPQPGEYGFDLDAALRGIVAVRALVPSDAFTAGTLGEERTGSGVLIPGGLILTMGYLVTEAETIWLTTASGGAVAGHVLGVDGESGFALVQPLGRVDATPLEFGDGDVAALGDGVILAAHGGRRHAIETRVVGRQEFAGYWEYVLDDAIFTAPAHPFWGGAALIGKDGCLLGIGSLILQQGARGKRTDMNMVVPVNRLLPVLDDLRQLGRVNRPPRPWLGLYAMESDEVIVVGGLADGGPADRAGVQVGDRVLAVGTEDVTDLAALWRHVWSSGAAGATVPLRLAREDAEIEVEVASADRTTFLRAPRLH